MFKFSFLTSLLFLPTVVLAAAPKTFAELLGLIVGLLDSLIPLIISLAVLVFLVGVSKYIWHSGNEAKRTEGRNFMIWGIVGIFVMVSFWGIVGFLQQTFFYSQGGGSFDFSGTEGGWYSETWSPWSD